MKQQNNQNNQNQQQAPEGARFQDPLIDMANQVMSTAFGMGLQTQILRTLTEMQDDPKAFVEQHLTELRESMESQIDVVIAQRNSFAASPQGASMIGMLTPEKDLKEYMEELINHYLAVHENDLTQGMPMEGKKKESSIIT